VITRLKLLVVALFWGGTFVAGRAIGAELAPQVSAVARFVMASAVLVFMAILMEGGLPRLNLRMFAVTAVLGFLGVFAYNSFFFAAVQFIPASRSAIIVATGPAVIALMTALAFGHHLSPLRWMGIGISFLGAIVVITHGEPAQIANRALGRGDWLMLGGVFSWALYTVASQRILKGLSPIAATTYASLWGTALLALYAIPALRQVSHAAVSAKNILCLLYIAIPGTVIAYIWYFDGIKELGAARAAVFNNFIPVFGVGLSALLLHEQIQASTLLGGLLVLGGVILTSRNLKEEPRSPRRSSVPAGRGLE
jgi:drug/metabolite transporter (DMT)-like permease